MSKGTGFMDDYLTSVLSVSDSDRRVPAELGQESQASSYLRKGNPLASRVVQGGLRPLVVKGNFPGGSDGKESACNAGNPGSIPGLGRSPGEGNGYPLQYSCLKNSMDRGARWATVHGVANCRTQVSDLTLSLHT